MQQLPDRAEISDVQLRYATGVDTRNWALLRTCFTDEVEVDFSSGFGRPAVRLTADAWVESIAPVMGALQATQHMITNHVITFDDDDHATCVAYVQASHHNPNDTGESDLVVYGFYSNRFERTASGRRIAACKLTVSWMTGNLGVLREQHGVSGSTDEQPRPTTEIDRQPVLVDDASLDLADQRCNREIAQVAASLALC